MSLGMGLFDLLMRFQMQVLNGLVQKLYVLIIAHPPFFVFFLSRNDSDTGLPFLHITTTPYKYPFITSRREVLYKLWGVNN